MKYTIATLKTDKASLYRYLRLRIFLTNKGIYVIRNIGNKVVLSKESEANTHKGLLDFLHSLTLSTASDLVIRQGRKGGTESWGRIVKPDNIVLQSECELFISCMSRQLVMQEYRLFRCRKRLKKLIVASQIKEGVNIVLEYSEDDKLNIDLSPANEADIPSEDEDIESYQMTQISKARKYMLYVPQVSIVTPYENATPVSDYAGVKFSAPFLCCSTGKVLQFGYEEDYVIDTASYEKSNEASRDHCRRCSFRNDEVSCNKTPPCSFITKQGIVPNKYTSDTPHSGWFVSLGEISQEEVIKYMGKCK